MPMNHIYAKARCQSVSPRPRSTSNPKQSVSWTQGLVCRIRACTGGDRWEHWDIWWTKEGNPQRATGKHRGQSEKNAGNWELEEAGSVQLQWAGVINLPGQAATQEELWRMELKLSQVRTMETNNRGRKQSQGISESKLPLKNKKSMAQNQ